MVGQRLPNSLGIHDMLGNVEEWVADAFHENCLSRQFGKDDSDAWQNPIVWPASSRGWKSSPEIWQLMRSTSLCTSLATVAILYPLKKLAFTRRICKQIYQRELAKMTLQLNLPPQLESMLQKRANAAGVDLSTFVVEALSTLEQDTIQPILSEAEFTAKLDRIVAIHANAPGEFDDSRESIYLGCGE